LRSRTEAPHRLFVIADVGGPTDLHVGDEATLEEAERSAKSLDVPEPTS
jgi:hypothetical protein